MRRSSAYPWTYVESLVAGRFSESTFADIRTYLMFIGQPRSGTSLLGSLLNAHPNALVAHELNALRYVRRGYTRRQLFWLLLMKDREFARRGRNWTGYDYAVPGQWQGRYEKLLVIGDKKAGCSSEQLGADPRLWERLGHRVRKPVRTIHLVRNPFNVITTIHRKRTRTSLEHAAEMYFHRCRVNAALIQQHPLQIRTLRLEDLIADPVTHLRALCEFLDLPADETYVQACSKILFQKPRQSQRSVVWPVQLVDRVRRQLERFAFLHGYEPLEMETETEPETLLRKCG